MLKKKIQSSFAVAVLVAASLFAPVASARPMNETHSAFQETVDYFESAWNFLISIFASDDGRYGQDGDG